MVYQPITFAHDVGEGAIGKPNAECLRGPSVQRNQRLMRAWQQVLMKNLSRRAGLIGMGTIDRVLSCHLSEIVAESQILRRLGLCHLMAQHRSIGKRWSELAIRDSPTTSAIGNSTCGRLRLFPLVYASFRKSIKSSVSCE